MLKPWSLPREVPFLESLTNSNNNAPPVPNELWSPMEIPIPVLLMIKMMKDLDSVARPNTLIVT